MTGFIKMVVKDDDEGTLLGVRAAGESASALIQCASLLIQV
jgi:pyruvate/2-oxoglutarate dehydrogenase complex dihydrolipoamide dehydrogenase (E3) component